MTEQAENAAKRYRKSLEQALADAPQEIKTEAIQDAEEFLRDETHAMDVGCLSSEPLAFDRFVERFGTPEQLAASYLEQTSGYSPSVRGSRGRWKQVAMFATAMFLAVSGVCYAVLREPPKLSPFTDVTFKDDKVLVTYEGKTSVWIALDHLTVKEIVASAKKQFGDRWQKRVAEDLIEVLWGMGHRPGETVKLRLLDTKTNAEQLIAKAQMTRFNRQVIWRSRYKVERELKARMLGSPPKLSPFTSVTFKEDQVFVTYEGKANRWIALDHLTVKEIVASAKKQFGDRWQKRIAEDLVEVLWGMGHHPEKTVQLRLLDAKTKVEQVVPKAQMTHENRRAIWKSRNKARLKKKSKGSATRSAHGYFDSEILIGASLLGTWKRNKKLLADSHLHLVKWRTIRCLSV